MRFDLLGINQDGHTERFHLQARDEADARAQGVALGYSILTLRGRTKLPSMARPRDKQFPVLQFSQELLVLLDAGLPLVVAIETLAENERHPAIRAIFDGIIATLRQGHPLSVALEEHGGTFTTLYIATVRASERTSDLGPTLARYVTYQNQIDALRKRIVSASIYPAILMIAGGLVSLFLLLYVMPRFAKIYEDRADLPWVSQMLLSWGRIVEGEALLVIGVLAALAATLWTVARSPRVRAKARALLWRLPVVGEQLKVYQLARFYRTVGMLLRGGLPLVQALKMAADLLHPVLRDRLTRARLSVSEGRSVSASLASHGLTTPVAVRLLSVGEQSANMGEMMERIALFHDEEISRAVDWFSRLLEPILMAVIGLVIGGIVILMYMPIFELAGSLN